MSNKDTILVLVSDNSLAFGTTYNFTSAAQVADLLGTSWYEYTMAQNFFPQPAG